MEEILASIRRIIEDSDVEKRRDGDDIEPVFSTPANDAAEHPKGIDAFRAEFGDYARQEAVEDEVSAAEPEPVALRAEHVDAAIVATTVARAHDAEMFAEYSAARPVEDVPAAAAGVSDTSGKALEADAPAVADAIVDEDALPRAPLTSENTGRQVAAAFGELSEAFAASRRRSFDEMAEEMLRPMLQDWLDNNLPHMVERLVKEEIERIARG